MLICLKRRIKKETCFHTVIVSKQVSLCFSASYHLYQSFLSKILQFPYDAYSNSSITHWCSFLVELAPRIFIHQGKVAGKLNLDICRTLRQYLSSGHLCRKRHNKDCALIRTRRGDGAPVQLYNLLCNGKSKPRAASR